MGKRDRFRLVKLPGNPLVLSLVYDGGWRIGCGHCGTLAPTFARVAEANQAARRHIREVHPVDPEKRGRRDP